MLVESDCETTVVVAVAAIGWPGGDVAVLVMVPPAGTVDGLVTMTVATAEPPPAIVPSPQVTVVVPVHPPEEVADTSVAPGNASATCTPVAAVVPVLLTVIVYVTFSPTCTGSGLSEIEVTSGLACFVITRSSSITNVLMSKRDRALVGRDRELVAEAGEAVLAALEPAPLRGAGVGRARRAEAVTGGELRGRRDDAEDVVARTSPIRCGGS